MSSKRRKGKIRFKWKCSSMRECTDSKLASTLNLPPSSGKSRFFGLYLRLSGINISPPSNPVRLFLDFFSMTLSKISFGWLHNIRSSSIDPRAPVFFPPLSTSLATLLFRKCSYSSSWTLVRLQTTICVTLGGRCAARRELVRRMMKWLTIVDSSSLRWSPRCRSASLASASRPRRMGFSNCFRK